MDDSESGRPKARAIFLQLDEHARQFKQVQDTLAKQAAQFAAATEQARRALAPLDQAAQALREFDARNRAMTQALESSTAKMLRDFHFDPVRRQLRELLVIDESIAKQLRASYLGIGGSAIGEAASRALKELAATQSAAAKLGRLFVEMPSPFRDLKLDTGTAEAIAALARQAALARTSVPDGSLFESIADVIDSATAGIADKGPEVPSVAVQPDSDSEETDADVRQWQGWLASKPLWVQLLAFFVLQIAVDLLVEAASSEVAKRWISSSDPDEQQRIVYEIHEHNIVPAMSALRCVAGTGVNVRAEPSKASAVVGRLQPGHAVEVVESLNGFSRIFYRKDPAGDILTGWAASGYLVKVAC